VDLDPDEEIREEEEAEGSINGKILGKKDKGGETVEEEGEEKTEGGNDEGAIDEIVLAELLALNGWSVEYVALPHSCSKAAADLHN